jgi:TatA/E family protein of Tat protein translocase
MVLLFLESVGTTELMLILVVALIVFGPRKLPELGRSLGKGLNEFKRASDDFKRTWEREANLEDTFRERQIGEAMLPPDEALAAATPAGQTIAALPDTFVSPAGAPMPAGPSTIPRGDEVRADASADAPGSPDGAEALGPAPQSPHKTDWV